jgi:Arc/MetJ-type ribon-helix-helix transcriptional regulator
MAALVLNSKTLTVTLPGDEARKLEVLAEREGRDASDIVAEAVQALWAERVEKLFAETRAYAATRNAHGYTEADVPRLIQEVREEADAEESERAIARVARAS